MLYKSAFNWMIFAFAVRLVACLAIHIYSLEAGFEGFYPLASGHDDTLYWRLADEIQNGHSSESIPSSYPLILAALFSLTGQNLLVGKLLTVIAGSLTLYVAVMLARDLASGIDMSQTKRNYSANLTGLFLTFYPSALWYSTQLIRDSFIVFFGILNLYISIKVLKISHRIYWILWGITLLVLYSLRPYMAVSVVISFLAYFMLIWNAKIKRKLLLLALILIPSALIPYFLGQGLFGLDQIIPMLSVDEVARQREQAYSIGGSSTGLSIDYSNPIIFILTFGQSYITAMLGPLPWQLSAAVQLISLPEAIVMWILLFRLWQYRSIKATQPKGKEERLLVLFCLILIGIIALFSDNIGANTRLRLLPWTSFLIYIAIEFAKKNAGKNRF